MRPSAVPHTRLHHQRLSSTRFTRPDEVVAWLGRIGDTGRTMVVSPELDERIGRAVANIPDVELRTPGSLRLSDVMESDTLLVTRPALEALALRAGERAEARA